MDVERNGDQLTLIAREPWTLTNTPLLKERIHEVMADLDEALVVLDFSHIQYIDSNGLKLVIVVYQHCASQKLPLEINAHTPTLLQLFETTGINRFIKINQVCPLIKPSYMAKAS